MRNTVFCKTGKTNFTERAKLYFAKQAKLYFVKQAEQNFAKGESKRCLVCLRGCLAVDRKHEGVFRDWTLFVTGERLEGFKKRE